MLKKKCKILYTEPGFYQSLWDLVQVENNSFKTLKLENFYKMLGKIRETGAPLWCIFPKFLKAVSR